MRTVSFQACQPHSNIAGVDRQLRNANSYKNKLKDIERQRRLYAVNHDANAQQMAEARRLSELNNGTTMVLEQENQFQRHRTVPRFTKYDGTGILSVRVDTSFENVRNGLNHFLTMKRAPDGRFVVRMLIERMVSPREQFTEFSIDLNKEISPDSIVKTASLISEMKHAERVWRFEMKIQIPHGV